MECGVVGGRGRRLAVAVSDTGAAAGYFSVTLTSVRLRHKARLGEEGSGVAIAVFAVKVQRKCG